MMKENVFEIVKKYIDRWDLEGLLPYAPADEYDMETERIAKNISKNDSAEVIAQVICDVFSQAFGEKKSVERYLMVAKEIKAELEENED